MSSVIVRSVEDLGRLGRAEAVLLAVMPYLARELDGLPSTHTTMATLTAGACVQAAVAPGRWCAAPALAAAAVGASRVYLGVHWPGDVVAGWLFAAGWLWLTEPG